MLSIINNQNIDCAKLLIEYGANVYYRHIREFRNRPQELKIIKYGHTVLNHAIISQNNIALKYFL